MNDQLASGLVFREVARRVARENAGTALGDDLARVAIEIAEDIKTFELAANGSPTSTSTH
jgi:hypothetical protein